jgi:integrase
MPRISLTPTFVAKAQAEPGRDRTHFWDAQLAGFGLMVTANGAKSYVVQYRAGRVSRRMALKGILSLTEARREAKAYLGQVAKGGDPLGERREKEAASDTVGSVAANFVKRHVEANGLRSEREIKRCLTKYVLARWEHRPFREIRRADVANLLDHIEDNHGARTADYCLAIIRKMCAWFETRDNDYASPVVKGMRRNNGDRRGKRILDDDEIRALWKACDEVGRFGDLLKLALLTAQRKDKVRTIQWSDIKDDVWTIARSPREKSTAGSLRLPQLALDIINRQPRIQGNPYVFPASYRDGPINSFGRRKAELDAKLPNVTPWVIHDLRRSARSLMSRAGVLPHISERVLGHAIPGVEGIYDRHAYDAEKAEALAKLAALVASIVGAP